MAASQHQHFCFPRNRLFPPLVETDTWGVSHSMCARVVRVAPKSGFPAYPGMLLKVLRGETNEVPTPLAPCKAVRSCSCPEYLQEVIAGAEGAILLVCWPRSRQDITAAQVNEKKVVEVEYAPSTATNAGAVEDSFTLSIEEGETFVCDLQFHRAQEDSSTKITTYDKPGDGVFGEVGVTIEGHLAIQWNRIDDAADAARRQLKVPAGFEYGPFYAVDAEGHLERTCSGQLVYAPHCYVAAQGTTWATVKLPVVKSDVAGPHRHCYT